MIEWDFMWNLRGLMGIYSGYHEIYPPAIKHGLLENPPFTSRIFPATTSM